MSSLTESRGPYRDNISFREPPIWDFLKVENVIPFELDASSKFFSPQKTTAYRQSAYGSISTATRKIRESDPPVRIFCSHFFLHNYNLWYSTECNPCHTMLDESLVDTTVNQPSYAQPHFGSIFTPSPSTLDSWYEPRWMIGFLMFSSLTLYQ